MVEVMRTREIPSRNAALYTRITVQTLTPRVDAYRVKAAWVEPLIIVGVYYCSMVERPIGSQKPVIVKTLSMMEF